MFPVLQTDTLLAVPVKSAELVQLSQQFQLLLLLLSQVLDFPVSDTLGLDFTEEAFLN